MSTITIAMGSDHAGFELKQQLIPWLISQGYEIIDFGTNSAESVDYPDYIHPVANSVSDLISEAGIIICGSGNGAAITANKHPKIRAALCWNAEIAMLAKQHNDANIISLPARYVSLNEAKEIITAYFSANFEGGRHSGRISKIPLKGS